MGQACGDALAAAAPGRGWSLKPVAPGEWSEALVPSVQLARITATGADLRQWRHRGTVRAAVSGWRSGPGPAATAISTAALTGLTALDDRARTADVARRMAEAAASETLVADACMLWAEVVRGAVVAGRLDLSGGLDLLPAERRTQWRSWIDDATASGGPGPQAGRSVDAILTAWSAVMGTPVPVEDPATGSYQCQHLQHALRAAVQPGTGDGWSHAGWRHIVGMLAGALLGARWGMSAVPLQWVRHLHGEPGLRSRDLVRLAVLTARGGRPVRKGWPSVATIRLAVEPPRAVRLRTDPGTWLGGIGSAGHDADAVMSLCVVGVNDVPARGVLPEDHLEPWIVSSSDLEDNPHREFALDDAARALLTLRGEGRRVLVHCTRAVHRTPLVAVRYLMLRGLSQREARAEVKAVCAEAGGPPE